MGRPEIRAEVTTGDGAVGSGFNGDSLFGGSLSLALLNLVEGPDTHPRGFREIDKGPNEFDSHGPSLAILANTSSPKNPFPEIGAFVQDIYMNKRHWPQRDFFRSLVDAKLAIGISKEDQAKAMDIAISSLVTHYSGDREPGKGTLRKMVAYYNVELADLTDDPGAALPGINSGELSHLSPAKRLIMRSVAQKLSPDDVTDEQAEKVWRALDSLIEAGKIRPPR
jgi:hypothetical protein